jgi:hypothetical protein
VAGLYQKEEEEETTPSVGKATHTAQPRAGDSISACSAWVRHLPPVLANTELR